MGEGALDHLAVRIRVRTRLASSPIPHFVLRLAAHGARSSRTVNLWKPCTILPTGASLMPAGGRGGESAKVLVGHPAPPEY